LRTIDNDQLGLVDSLFLPPEGGVVAKAVGEVPWHSL
jgi:hypothetical protein